MIRFLSLMACMAVLLAPGAAAQASKPAHKPAAFTMIAAGSAHRVALDRHGVLWVWGENTFGQLGLGDDNEIKALAGGEEIKRSHPGRLGGGYNFVAAYRTHTLAIRDDGSVWGWGWKVPGLELDKTYHRPTLITRQPMAKVFSGSLYALTLDRNNTMWELGRIGEEKQQAGLAPMFLQREVQSIAASWQHAAVLLQDGTAWTFGPQHADGRLGREPIKYRKLGQVGADDHVAASVGMTFTQFRKTDGSSIFYGDMGYLKPLLGTLKSEWKDRLEVLTPYVAILNFQKNHAGTNSVYLLKDSGELDEIKVSFKEGKATAQAPVTIATGLAAIAGGDEGYLGLKKDGTLWAWGSDRRGLLGLGERVTQAATPLPVKFTHLVDGGSDEKN